MHDGFIKVAAATGTIKVADPAYNAGQIKILLQKALDEQVKVLALPELCISGYTCGDLFLQPVLLDGVQAALADICRFSAGHDMLFAVGAPLQNNQKLYNCAVIIQNGKFLGVVPKTFLPSYGEFYEKRWFSPAPAENGEIKIGEEWVPFGSRLLFCCENLPALTLAAEICEDLWAPVPPSSGHSLAGANLILNLSCSDETIGKADYRRRLCQTQSARAVCGYIYADAGEGESTTDMVFSGHNLICENGALLAETPLFKNGFAVSEIDLEKLTHDRRRLCTFPPADAAGYKKIPFSQKITATRLTRAISPTPFIPQNADEKAARCEEILAMQTAGLATRLSAIGTPKAVIGLSGGLDSTLAFLVCAKAMEKLGRPLGDVLAVTMPCFGTTARTKNNAEILAKEYGATFIEIDITSSVLEHFTAIGHDPAVTDITYENAQARERTQVLMDLANQENGIVVGTGDLSELALGWATYNGDHMSMYAVNSSVPKTLVRHIVEYAAKSAQNPALQKVLEDILATPVSPELIPGTNGQISQITEDIVGPYLLHDFFLYYMARWGFGPKKIYRLALAAFSGQFTADEIKKWLKNFYRRFFSQQFKRSCMPDGPKIGSVSLSPRGDWRMPSDASARLWLDILESL